MAYISLGSNLGDSRSLLHQAVRLLRRESRQEVVCSSLWRTSPVDCPPGSRPFLNAVVRLVPRVGEGPESFLVKLQAIELALGRTPKNVLNEPRPIDLDLIAFGEEVRKTPALTLPHPRAHSRRFVLEPLAEIAPDLRLPRQTQTVRQLLDGLKSRETAVKQR